MIASAGTDMMISSTTKNTESRQKSRMLHLWRPIKHKIHPRANARNHWRTKNLRSQLKTSNNLVTRESSKHFNQQLHTLYQKNIWTIKKISVQGLRSTINIMIVSMYNSNPYTLYNCHLEQGICLGWYYSLVSASKMTILPNDALSIYSFLECTPVLYKQKSTPIHCNCRNIQCFSLGKHCKNWWHL